MFSNYTLIGKEIQDYQECCHDGELEVNGASLGNDSVDPHFETHFITNQQTGCTTIQTDFIDDECFNFFDWLYNPSIESDLTRFVIAALSVTHLIYMSEVGALLIGSKIPVNFLELFVIFILRTVVTLPIIALMGHLIL